MVRTLTVTVTLVTLAVGTAGVTGLVFVVARHHLQGQQEAQGPTRAGVEAPPAVLPLTGPVGGAAGSPHRRTRRRVKAGGGCEPVTLATCLALSN